MESIFVNLVSFGLKGINNLEECTNLYGAFIFKYSISILPLALSIGLLLKRLPVAGNLT